MPARRHARRGKGKGAGNGGGGVGNGDDDDGDDNGDDNGDDDGGDEGGSSFSNTTMSRSGGGGSGGGGRGTATQRNPMDAIKNMYKANYSATEPVFTGMTFSAAYLSKFVEHIDGTDRIHPPRAQPRRAGCKRRDSSTAWDRGAQCPSPTEDAL